MDTNLLKKNLKPGEIFQKEFENILNLFKYSYSKLIMKIKKTKLSELGENLIRDYIVQDFLKIYKSKFSLSYLFFDSEIEETKKISNEYVNTGRTDICIRNFKGFEGEEDKKLIFECKRLNKQYNNYQKFYISNGMKRFEDTYPTSFNIGIMLGFIQDIGLNRISELKSCIEDNSDSFIKSDFEKIDNKDLDEIYCHKTNHQKNENKLTIYHIFYDFT